MPSWNIGLLFFIPILGFIFRWTKPNSNIRKQAGRFILIWIKLQSKRKMMKASQKLLKSNQTSCHKYWSKQNRLYAQLCQITVSFRCGHSLINECAANCISQYTWGYTIFCLYCRTITCVFHCCTANSRCTLNFFNTVNISLALIGRWSTH